MTNDKAFDDLVERLTRPLGLGGNWRHANGGLSYQHDEERAEAAYEIKSLRAQLAAAEANEGAKVQTAKSNMDFWFKKWKDAEAQLQTARKALGKAQVAIEATIEMHRPDHAGLLLSALNEIDRSLKPDGGGK